MRAACQNNATAGTLLAEGPPATHSLAKVSGVVGLCTLATFSEGYDLQALGLAIPNMAAEFHVQPTAFTAAASASLVGIAAGAMLLSPLAERHGADGSLGVLQHTPSAGRLSADVYDVCWIPDRSAERSPGDDDATAGTDYRTLPREVHYRSRCCLSAFPRPDGQNCKKRTSAEPQS
jgi:hypothetical protein